MRPSILAFADELEKIAAVEKDAGLRDMYLAAATKARETKERAKEKHKKFQDAVLEKSIKLHLAMPPLAQKIVEDAQDPNSPDTQIPDAVQRAIGLG